MKRKAVSVIVTDLDNTLFDWVDIWYNSFRAMLDTLIEETGIAEDILVREFKQIHEKYGTSEYAFSIEELPSVKAKYPGENLAERFDSPIYAYRKARKNALRLYPGVEETLKTLNARGCLLVGYTESMSFYTNYRMRHLGLDELLDYLYAPPDHKLPKEREAIRRYPKDHYALKHTIQRHLSAGELKPNPRVLLDITNGVGAKVETTIYVGDSLMKDIVMAQQARVTDVWAQYGVAHNREEYELLRRVTHWRSSAVQKEKVLTQEGVKPTYILKQTFRELLDLFEFTPFDS